jgi:sarcosine oxidase subunit gamma
MPDLSTRRHYPLDALSTAMPSCPAAEFRALPLMTRFIFRCRQMAIETAGRAFGLSLPQAACRASIAGNRAALWLGPDEWLLLTDEGEATAIMRLFAVTLATLPHSLVDVSHANTGLTIKGPQAATVLNHGCPLDLSLSAFPVGACTRTILGKVEIVLWRRAEGTFHIETWRSFGAYVLHFLEEARREYEG